MIYVVLYLQIVTRNKAIGVRVIDSESGKEQTENEKKTCTTFELLLIEVEVTRGAHNFTMKQRKEGVPSE